MENNEIIIGIADNGRGIPKEHQEKIFDKFFQMDGSENEKRYGVGLGLTFCKMASEAQNAKIWVESEENKGACFKLAFRIIEN